MRALAKANAHGITCAAELVVEVVAATIGGEL
jgi:hypothetical protein